MIALCKRPKRWIRAAGLLLVLFGAHAHGQEWPQRPIRLVLPGPPGGSSDIPARLLAHSLGAELKQTVVVENRPGASGLISAREVATAKPDGYTLLLTSGSAITVTTGIMPDMADIARKLLPIGMLAYTPMGVAVAENSPIQSMGQLLKLARDKPDTLVVANPQLYTLAHLSTELISERAKAPVRAISFNSFGGELVAVKNGDAVALIDGAAPILAQAAGKGLRILAISSQERLPGMEQYPLLKETVPDTTVIGWYGLFAPAGLPSPIAQRLSAALNRAKADAKFSASLQKLGMYTHPDDPSTFAAYVREQTELWHRLLAKLGMGKEKAK